MRVLALPLLVLGVGIEFAAGTVIANCWQCTRRGDCHYQMWGCDIFASDWATPPPPTARRGCRCTKKHVPESLAASTCCTGVQWYGNVCESGNNTRLSAVVLNGALSVRAHMLNLQPVWWIQWNIFLWSPAKIFVYAHHRCCVWMRDENT